MKVCIVGGTGNISTSIVRLLLQQGHEVTCFHRGLNGRVVDGACEIIGDRQQREHFEQTMQQARFDAAIDMICFSRQDAESSVRAFRDVQHFVQCSSVVTYGVKLNCLPADEDHPLQPLTAYARGKVDADQLFLAAHEQAGFPVTIMKPSSTYGPQLGLARQIAAEFSWLDRIRKGKSILVCGDGQALHQFLHVDDAALAFANVLGKPHCIGQTYNVVNRGCITWADYHQTVMQVIGKQVPQIGLALADITALELPGLGICRDIFAHHAYYGAEKIFRDVAEFRPTIALPQGIALVLEAMTRAGRIPNSDEWDWEDRVIAAQQQVRNTKIEHPTKPDGGVVYGETVGKTRA